MVVTRWRTWLSLPLLSAHAQYHSRSAVLIHHACLLALPSFAGRFTSTFYSRHRPSMGIEDDSTSEVSKGTPRGQKRCHKQGCPKLFSDSDDHSLCTACRQCTREVPCTVCLLWSDATWDKFLTRRTYAAKKRPDLLARLPCLWKVLTTLLGARHAANANVIVVALRP